MMKKLHWQHADARVLTLFPPAELVDWLLDPGSFIQRLKHYHIAKPRVHVLSQRWEMLPLDERKLLHVPERQYGLVREVLIDSSEGQWMFARTIFPATTLTGKDRMLARLKSRSLGSVLFKDPTVLRGDFEIAAVESNTSWHQKIKTLARVGNESLWARRSLFYLQHKSLLLAEVFLPDILKLSR
jgi:chorismate--pyruvate lyase